MKMKKPTIVCSNNNNNSYGITFRNLLLYAIIALTVTGDSEYGPSSGGIFVSAAGGELAKFTIEQMTPGVSYRQDVCDRYEAFTNGTVELKDALAGMDLNVLMSAYEEGYFNYDSEFGINPDYPGLSAVLMDELARLGNFRWRNSFGISDAPYGNHSWTDLLVWGTEVYDMNIDWWAQNIERMNMGVAFLEEWYDSSIVLIRKKPEETISNEINFWNWTRPYDGRVWALTVITIFFSGLAYQWLEYLAKERDGRTMWEWWSENAYKGFLGFTQEYQFEPKTFEGRIFGISISIWALVMTATYTANLASLLVDRSLPPVIITSIDEAIQAKTPICTLEGTNSDAFIKLNFKAAIRVEKKTLEEVYRGLQVGECDLAAEVVASWEELNSVRKYNPTCNLERVSATVFPNKAGFATKADAGNRCSGLIRDVINLHMSFMISEGFVQRAWEREHKFSLDIDCDAYRPDLDTGRPFTESPATTTPVTDGEDGTRRQLLPNPTTQIRSRSLKGGRRGAAAGIGATGEDGGASEELTLEQMIGTFMLHWSLTALAIFIGYMKLYYNRYNVKKQHTFQEEEETCHHPSKNDKHFSRRGTTTTEFTSRSTDENLTSSRPNSKVCFEESSLDEENDLRTTTSDAGTCRAATTTATGKADVSDQLWALQDSQVRMHQNHCQLLEEQRMLKEQIQLLVATVNRQSTQMEEANRRSSSATNN